VPRPNGSKIARECTGHGRIALRDDSQLPDTEPAVRIMLADLTHIEALVAERRQEILGDFRHFPNQLASWRRHLTRTAAVATMTHTDAQRVKVVGAIGCPVT
jgi:hypothetical protein